MINENKLIEEIKKITSIGKNDICWKSDCLYFELVEKAEEAVKTVGEERVKKYYLGVGE